MDDLPRYMKVYYHSLCDVMNEIEEELEKLGMPDRIHYAKQVVCPFFASLTDKMLSIFSKEKQNVFVWTSE